MLLEAIFVFFPWVQECLGHLHGKELGSAGSASSDTPEVP